MATCTAERGQGDPEGDIDALIGGIIDDKNAWEWFTEGELAFLQGSDVSPHESVQLSWRYEAALPLYWALGGGGKDLPPPTEECDVGALTLEARDNDGLANRELRSKSELLDEADLIYRYHWAVRQSTLDGQSPGGNLHPGIVIERHHALNWLTCDAEVDWEQVSTDT